MIQQSLKDKLDIAGGEIMQIYAGNNKKMLNMLILEILKEYTDCDHRLTQK